MPDWLENSRDDWDVDAEKHGFESFAYHARRPFHPDRLNEFIDGGGFKGAIRSKRARLAGDTDGVCRPVATGWPRRNPGVRRHVLYPVPDWELADFSHDYDHGHDHGHLH